MPINPLRTALSGGASFLLAVWVCFLLAPSAVAIADGEPVVLARVDGDAITTADLDEILAVQKRPDRGAPDPARHSSERLLRRMIQNRLLELEGYRNETEKTPLVRNQVVDLARHRGMIALLDSVTAEVPRAVPEEFGPALGQINVIQRVSHILVDNEALASALVDSLESGAAFELLVERYSQDSTTVKVAGDLGWARSDLYIPEFRAVLEGREEGDVLGPVQTERGWHVLLLAELHLETVGQSVTMQEQVREAVIEERVMAEVRKYVESLRVKYEYTLDQELLASLDYASEDEEVQAELRRSKEVLASVSWRDFTVSEFTREIRFEHYHGLKNKPNAAELRDETLDEWVTELILRHEAAAQGFDRRPEIVRAAKRLERSLVREQVLGEIVDFRFEPTPAEIESYYAAHPDQFTPSPRVHVAGVSLRDEASARAFRESLEQGAKLAWLAARAPGVVDPAPGIFGNWLEPRELGIPGTVTQGEIFGPIESDGVWMAGEILEVEAVAPTPLDQCGPAVVGAMRSDRTREVMADSLERLEAAAAIEILPDATKVIDARLERWIADAPETRVP